MVATSDYWWLDVIGKGSKRRRIPVNQTLLTELMAYRRALNLPDLPQPGEQEPLIKSQLTKKGVTDRRVNQLIKKVVNQAARFYDQVDEKKAQRLRKFSAHWLRHLSVTMQGRAGVAKHHIKDNVGHEKWQTTEGYFHSQDYERHHDMEKHDWLLKKSENGQ